ncbi:hypothetical protein J9253_01605 [Thiothrix litoralis]|uniref:Uncharacterized protein n=1 Tax=Thiothrix litoralis TaxID=2891210 RepID=A0ABX7X0K7_9GAMM|nr:hypothetical protein [Thiothrix litoralis]QTR46680.1 hypothetical protein J9253_01605 [Thiothrix litoralis]
MREYLYPAHPCNDWFQIKVINAWQASEKPFFAFSFCKYTPHILIDNESNHNDQQPFWLYIYYSDKKIREGITDGWCDDEDSRVAMQVEHRIRVLTFTPGNHNPFSPTDTHDSSPCDHGEEKIWFKCDRIEKINKLDQHGKLANLHFYDFKHTRGLSVAQAMINSIPPVCRTSPLIIRKSWQYTDEPASCSSQP